MLPKFCVVVPCFNEEESLPVLVDELKGPLESATRGQWSIIMVDDGSTDATARLIWEYHAREPRIHGVRLSRNFGHQAAVAAGLNAARGECIGVIDADLQDPVGVLLQMYDKVSRDGWDACSGVRGRREEVPWWLNFAYRWFYRCMARLSEHPWTIDAGDFAVFNRRVHEAMQRLPECQRVPRGLRSWVGFRQTTLTYERPPRRHGRSKYSLFRLTMLAVSSVVSFSTAPLRLATIIGLSMAGLTLLAAVVFTLNRFFPQMRFFGYNVGENPGTTTIVLYISFIASMFFFCMGVLGEYLAVILKEVKARPVTIVAETTDTADELPRMDS